MNVRQIIDRNREALRLFEKCINTNDTSERARQMSVRGDGKSVMD